VEILIKGVAVRGHTVDDGSPLTAIKAQLVVGTRSGEKISFTKKHLWRALITACRAAGD